MSHLDYCNSLFNCLSETSSACEMSRKWALLPPILISFHGLPIKVHFYNPCDHFQSSVQSGTTEKNNSNTSSCTVRVDRAWRRYNECVSDFFDVFSGSTSSWCYLPPAYKITVVTARYWILHCHCQNLRFETSERAPRLSLRTTKSTFQCAERRKEKNTTSLIIPIFSGECDIYLLIEKWNSKFDICCQCTHTPLINPDSCLPARTYVCMRLLYVMQLWIFCRTHVSA